MGTHNKVNGTHATKYVHDSCCMDVYAYGIALAHTLYVHDSRPNYAPRPPPMGPPMEVPPFKSSRSWIF
jgi:hypothetical protein